MIGLTIIGLLIIFPQLMACRDNSHIVTITSSCAVVMGTSVQVTVVLVVVVGQLPQFDDRMLW